MSRVVRIIFVTECGHGGCDICDTDTTVNEFALWLYIFNMHCVWMISSVVRCSPNSCRWVVKDSHCLALARFSTVETCLNLWCSGVSKTKTVALSLIPGREGGGSPPQSVPGSSRGVADRLWRFLLARCPSWRDRGLDTGTPDARPSRRRCGSAGRWLSPGARYGEGKLLPVGNDQCVPVPPSL